MISKKIYKKTQNFIFRYILPRDSSRYSLYKNVRRYILKKAYFWKVEPKKYTLEPFAKEYTPYILPSTPHPVVSIIIPAYNKFNYTYLCIKSIIAYSQGVEYEIIIADDVSTDETAAISSYFKNIIVSRNSSNLGFLRNCNAAAQKARGAYILFLNNDTQVQKDWLSSLVELIEGDAHIGMVGSKLVYPDGRLQEAGGIVWKDASAWNFGKLDDPEKPAYNYVKEADYISGASIMIKRCLWEKIGGFDETFAPAYYEDVDLAFQVRAEGFKVVYQPKSVVVHFEGVSHGKESESGIKKYQTDNKEKFSIKWKSELEKNHFPNAMNVFQARDRSREKRTILIIDHYVPTFDKDAGSKVAFLYLKLYVEMGFNVKFIGDNFHRLEPYTSALQMMGVEVLYGSFMADNWKKWIKENSEFLDFIYLSRPHIAMRYIPFLKQATRAKLIYFVVDLHFLREMREYEITQNKITLNSSHRWKKIEGDIIHAVDSVLTISSDEARVMPLEFNINPDKIIVFPMFYYDTVDLKSLVFNSRRDLLFVGGFTHDPNVDGITWFVNDIFPSILSAYPDIILNIVGSNPPEKILKLAAANICIRGNVSDDELFSLYQTTRIAVVPLRYGAGVKGKVVDAMYNGIPLVGTSIAFEGLSSFDNMYPFSNTADEFAAEVIRLYHNNEILESLSNKGKAYISQNFSKNAAITVMKHLLS